MSRKKIPGQLAFDFDAPVSQVADTIAAGWAALRRFHAAVVNFNPAEQQAARQDLRIAAVEVHGDCEYDRLTNLLYELRAADDEPLFGQAFRRVVEIDGCAVEVVYEGFGSLGFMSCHAVDWDSPFISSTGFRSVLHTPPYGSLNAHGYAALGQVIDHVVARIHADIADKKGRVGLVPIEEQWREIHFGTHRRAAA